MGAERIACQIWPELLFVLTYYYPFRLCGVTMEVLAQRSAEKHSDLRGNGRSKVTVPGGGILLHRYCRCRKKLVRERGVTTLRHAPKLQFRALARRASLSEGSGIPGPLRRCSPPLLRIWEEGVQCPYVEKALLFAWKKVTHT